MFVLLSYLQNVLAVVSNFKCEQYGKTMLWEFHSVRKYFLYKYNMHMHARREFYEFTIRTAVLDLGSSRFSIK